ncbi:hypothetical protein [Pseudomonas sp. EGD-AK9]|uniref:hypothetical protein n=1 Tax=Pseudomonas sp. EGD-AK9 TaxID=1386078 RepID=UPI0012E171E1|nr:hypothetical protein [Pseudomonas sp. EGD-AK9]
MAVGVDQDGDERARMIGPLPDATVLLFHHARVEMLEDFFVDKAVIILGQQIKNVAGKQEALIHFNRAFLERG